MISYNVLYESFDVQECIVAKKEKWRKREPQLPKKKNLLFSKLFDTCRFSAESAQVVEFRSAHTPASYDLDILYTVGVERKDPLDTYIVGTDLSDDESFSGTLSSYSDTDTFEILYTGLFTLFDVHRYAYGISGTKLRNILACNLSLLERLNISIFHHYPFG